MNKFFCLNYWEGILYFIVCCWCRGWCFSRWTRQLSNSRCVNQYMCWSWYIQVNRTDFHCEGSSFCPRLLCINISSFQLCLRPTLWATWWLLSDNHTIRVTWYSWIYPSSALKHDIKISFTTSVNLEHNHLISCCTLVNNSINTNKCTIKSCNQRINSLMVCWIPAIGPSLCSIETEFWTTVRPHT